MSSLEKAVFEVYENAESSSPKETISVLFNPSEYSISGGAEYESYKNKAGTSNSDKSDKKNYTGAKKQVLNLELFFDTSARQMLGGTTKDASDCLLYTSSPGLLSLVSMSEKARSLLCETARYIKSWVLMKAW